MPRVSPCGRMAMGHGSDMRMVECRRVLHSALTGSARCKTKAGQHEAAKPLWEEVGG